MWAANIEPLATPNGPQSGPSTRRAVGLTAIGLSAGASCITSNIGATAAKPISIICFPCAARTIIGSTRTDGPSNLPEPAKNRPTGNPKNGATKNSAANRMLNRVGHGGTVHGVYEYSDPTASSTTKAPNRTASQTNLGRELLMFDFLGVNLFERAWSYWGSEVRLPSSTGLGAARAATIVWGQTGFTIDEISAA